MSSRKPAYQAQRSLLKKVIDKTTNDCITVMIYLKRETYFFHFGEECKGSDSWEEGVKWYNDKIEEKKKEKKQ